MGDLPSFHKIPWESTVSCLGGHLGTPPPIDFPSHFPPKKKSRCPPTYKNARASMDRPVVPSHWSFYQAPCAKHLNLPPPWEEVCQAILRFWRPGGVTFFFLRFFCFCLHLVEKRRNIPEGLCYHLCVDCKSWEVTNLKLKFSMALNSFQTPNMVESLKSGPFSITWCFPNFHPQKFEKLMQCKICFLFKMQNMKNYISPSPSPQKNQDQASLTCVRCFLLHGFSAPQGRKACKERIAILSFFEVAEFPKATPQKAPGNRKLYCINLLKFNIAPEKLPSQ